MSSVHPFGEEEVRQLAHGVLVSAEALQSVMPGDLTDGIEQARALLTEAARRLDS